MMRLNRLKKTLHKAPAFFTSLLLLLLMVCAFAVGLYPSEEISSGTFKIHEIKRSVTSIQSTLIYSGKLGSLPCHIYFHPQDKRPPANCDYFLSQGTLQKRSPGHYTFKPECEWVPIKNTWSLAEWRFQVKKWVKRSIRSRFSNTKVAALLAGLATGHLEQPLLSYHFSAIGLSHLLAISGFHFALLTFFLGGILRWFLKEKVLSLSLMTLLGAYFLYMGGSPSVSRAWIGVFLYLFGKLFGYRTTPLNALGVALLFSLIGDPFVITQIGFQLSFGATLGIILFYRFFEEKCTSFFPKRPYPVLLEMSFIDQWGYLMCAFLRKGLALQGAVLAFTLPLLLFHFETFPLISLFYNLFVPLLLSLILALFLLHLDFLTAPLTSFLITLVEGAPRPLLLNMSSSQAAILVVGILLISFIQRRARRAKKNIVAT